MIAFVLAILLMLLALLAVTLHKTYFYLPRKELKRQAAHGQDQLAKTLFRAAAYGNELKLLLWFVIGVSAAGGIVLFARIAPPPLGFVVVVLVLWLAFVWVPRTRLTAVGAQAAAWCTPVVVEILRFIHPAAEYLAGYLDRFHMGPHTGLYEREDFYELVERQQHQSDSRISDDELERMRKVLQFGDLQIRDVMVPSKHVRAVSVDDEIGPVLLDELHATKHARFPVYDGKPTNIVGTLALDAIAGAKQHGKIQDHVDHRLAFLHENDSLERALRAFYETRQHLFIVVNNFNEYTGIVTLTGILHELVGAIEHEAFGRHDDRKAVAERHTHKEEKEQPEEKSSEESTRAHSEVPSETEGNLSE